MRLVLIAPGWQAAKGALPAEEGTAGQNDGLPTRIADRFMDEPDPASSWQAVLADELDLIVPGGSIADVPAANAYLEDTGRHPPAGVLLCADPVGLAPDRDSAVLQPPEALGLSAAESDALIHDIGAFIAEDELTLHAGSACRWYLAGEWLPERLGQPPEALAFTRPDPGAPRGVDSPDGIAERRLRRLGSELEMLLHAHPINERRREQGMPTVSSLHFWGVARVWSRSVRAPDPSNEAIIVIGDDAFTRTAAAAAGIRCEATGSVAVAASRLVVDLSLRDAWLAGDSNALLAAQAALERRWLRPALALYDQGELTSIEVRGDSGVRSVARAATRAGALAGFARMLARLRTRITGARQASD